jgi:hypothetical protein
MTMKLRVVSIFAVCLVRVAFSQNTSTSVAKASRPPFLSFHELKDLATVAKPEDSLAEKLNEILTTPFIGNVAAGKDVRPHRPTVQGLGTIVRAASWNIERGLNFDLIESALANPEQFQHDSGYQNRAGNDDEVVRAQVRTLQDTDVLVLNEIDLGMKRTEYRDISVTWLPHST